MFEPTTTQKIRACMRYIVVAYLLVAGVHNQRGECMSNGAFAFFTITLGTLVIALVGVLVFSL